MAKNDTSGQAFPRTGEGVGNAYYDVPGMTRRQWYAGQIMAALVGSNNSRLSLSSTEETARSAWRYADALLATEGEDEQP